ncbi:unnamed protein product [Gadus morhua 'NCC']
MARVAQPAGRAVSMNNSTGFCPPCLAVNWVIGGGGADGVHDAGHLFLHSTQQHAEKRREDLLIGHVTSEGEKRRAGIPQRLRPPPHRHHLSSAQEHHPLTAINMMFRSAAALVLLSLALSTAESCKPHKRSVCGSNAKTYRNHCELHRDACLTGLKIQVDHDGHCQEKKSELAAASPVVCYVADRNELRSRVIQWLQTEVVPDGWFNKGSNFSDILLRYFKTYDNGDTQLDSSELLKFIQHNDSNVDLQSYADQESNRLLRSLCVDALIELSDDNADWKLSFDEFLNCLKPGFNPPEKKCALEDETYEDGAETQVECNRCVCACGNWVCTAMTCADKTALVDESADAGAEVTEEEWNRRVAELNKHQETVEKMKASTKEV